MLKEFVTPTTATQVMHIPINGNCFIQVSKKSISRLFIQELRRKPAISAAIVVANNRIEMLTFFVMSSRKPIPKAGIELNNKNRLKELLSLLDIQSITALDSNPSKMHIPPILGTVDE
jgi:hypothetical protein